jgi:ParB family chromosome partitioning protein
VKFVGLDAYREAGGVVREDLFGEEVFLETPEIVERLATAKFDAAIEQLKKEGWAWVEKQPDDYTYRYQCSRITAKKGGKFDAEEMKLAGCFVSLSREGALAVDRGVVKPEDKRKLAKGKDKDAKSKAAPQEKGFSQSLLLSLKSFRLQVAHVALASKPDLAYDLLVFAAAGSLLGDECGARCLDIRFGDKTPATGQVQDTQAAKALSQIRVKLPLKWLDLGNEAKRFEEFRKLTPAQKASVLAYCVALTLEPSLAPEPDHAQARDIALALSGVDVAAYWRPTADNFLSKITSSQLIALGSGILGKLWSARRGNTKKGDLVKELNQAFAEPKTHAAIPDAQEKLRTWLPDGMAFTLPEKAPAKAKKKAA